MSIPSFLCVVLAILGQQVRIGNLPTIPNGIVTPPQVVQSPSPLYTEDARKARIEGIVTIQAEFDIDGNFKVLRVVKGLGHGLDESALAALKNWRFTPAYRNGQRVSVVALIDVNFIIFDDPKWVRENIREPAWLDYRKEEIRSAIERHFELPPTAFPD